MKRKLFILIFSTILSLSFFNVASASLTDGLVGYWTFDGKDTNWRTRTVLDKTGNGHTGTFNVMSTMTSHVTGKIGQ